MPKKKEVAPEPPRPVTPPEETDPAVIAAREAWERDRATDRVAFEQGEAIARRAMEALENIGWRCVGCEKEKRLAPEAWAERVSLPGAPTFYVKLLTGNRGLPQQLMELRAEEGATLATLKRDIYDYACAQPELQAVTQWFSPAFQTLLLHNHDIGYEKPPPPAPTPVASSKGQPPPPPPPPPPVAVPPDTLLSDLGVHRGATLLLTLRTPHPSIHTLPSMVRA